jgi:hypothetical protein
MLMPGADTLGGGTGAAAPTSAAPVTTPTPQSPVAAAVARAAATRAAILAGAAGAKPAGAPAPAVAPPVVPAAPAAAAPAAATPAKPGDPAAPGAAPAPVGAPPAADEIPAGVQAQVRKFEQHARRQLAEERQRMLAEVEQHRTSLQPRLAKATELEGLLERAGQDPMALLAVAERAGYGADNLEMLAQLFYAHSAEGLKDPRRKAAAQAALRGREQAGSVSKLEREIAEMKQQAQERERAAAIQTHMTQYAASAVAAIGDSTPLAAAIKDSPELQQRLLGVAARLYHESGPSDDLREEPEPAEVVRAYEAQRRAELEAMRPEFEALARIAAPAAAAAPLAAGAAATTPPAVTPPADPPAPPVTRRPTREELLAGIAENKRRLAAQRAAAT